MRGPNQWSTTQKQLIVLKVEIEEIPDEEVKDFVDRAIDNFPNLSEKYTLETNSIAAIAQIIRHIACELQSIAGMACTYSRSKPTRNKNEYFIIFSYLVQPAGKYAGEAAVAITECLLLAKPCDVSAEVKKLNALWRRYDIGPTSDYLLNEIKRREIPYRQFDFGNLMTLGYGKYQRKIRSALTDKTSALGMEMAGNKEETKAILREAGFPVPDGTIVDSEEELLGKLPVYSFPLVIKPLNGNQGRGITTNIMDEETTKYAFERARGISSDVVIEKHIYGEDYRFLLVNHKLVAVARRIPAQIKGDGFSTVQQLIDAENARSERGNTSEHVLALIKIDKVTKKILSDRGLSLNSVLPKGEKLILKETANISSGGVAVDVTEHVHPEIVFMMERVSRLFHLDICGIDVIAKSIEKPLGDGNGAIVEVNAGPGLRMHSNPQQGKSRDIAALILDMLFPPETKIRVPVVAVTGTNGKTTTVRLIAHMASTAGYIPGYCTTDGIYINHHQVFQGDCSGSLSARTVLFDPAIDFAVLECARGGIIRSGLGFDKCDISVITNITADHLGLNDVDTVEELTKVKAVVARSTLAEGFAILNADDDRVFSLYDELNCYIALYSLDAENQRVKHHIAKKGLAATINNGRIVIYNDRKIILEKLKDIPLSYNGKADFMSSNILAASLVGIISGFSKNAMRHALQSFAPSPEKTPGRLNMFDFGGFKVMLDYAHNTDGFEKIKGFLSKLGGGPKTGVVSVAGDRREEDIFRMGTIIAETFDSIIVYHPKSEREKTHEMVADILVRGIEQVRSQPDVKIIPNDLEAIDYAISQASEGALIFVCVDKVPDTIAYVKNCQEKFQQIEKIAS